MFSRPLEPFLMKGLVNPQHRATGQVWGGDVLSMLVVVAKSRVLFVGACVSRRLTEDESNGVFWKD